MLALWGIFLVLCVVGTSVSSRSAVKSALRIADATRMSPALVGLTVVSIGTDLPEIANSLVSSASGHGDVAVGDAMGSVITQVTMVLGLLCLVAKDSFTKDTAGDRNFVISVGTGACFGTALVWMLVQDQTLSHTDGLMLITVWVGGTILMGSAQLTPRRPEEVGGGSDGVGAGIGKTVFWLGLVGAFAIGVVQSFLQLAEAFGIPEFIGSFVALSIGTSLPELVVDWNAIRRGASSMAVGVLFGSSFVDATLSIGIGPAVFAPTVSEDVRGGILFAGIGMLLATLLVARTDRFDRRLGLVLLAVYGAVQAGTAFIKI